ncbi:MAG: hypothetical protein OEY44_00020 [Candidatus Peregrinibacteria bacterium]|nr:hypothetical protein [Candidatus Peregrinibacteria bacterium]
MKDAKSTLRHAILNQLTVLDFSIADANLTEKAKWDLKKHIRLISLLISYEELFLGKDRSLFFQEVSLVETCEILRDIHAPELKSKKVKLEIKGEDLHLKVDRRMFQAGLEQLLLRIIRLGKDVSLEVQEGEFSFKYTGEMLPEPTNQDLADILKSYGNQVELLGYHLGLHLLELHGVKIKMSEGVVKLSLPKSLKVKG